MNAQTSQPSAGDSAQITAGLRVVLTDGQRTRLRDLVNNKQDALFDKLHAATAAKLDQRAEGLRESLRFWDEIDLALRDAGSQEANVTAPELLSIAGDLSEHVRELVRIYGDKPPMSAGIVSLVKRAEAAIANAGGAL